jgi:hypothetical protein
MAARGGKRQGMVARPNNPEGRPKPCSIDSAGETVRVKARELRRRLYAEAKRPRGYRQCVLSIRRDDVRW